MTIKRPSTSVDVLGLLVDRGLTYELINHQSYGLTV